MIKKLQFVMALLVIAFNGYSQNNLKSFQLLGNITNTTIDSVKLSYFSQKTRYTETAPLQNGKFKFSGNLTEPVSASITFLGKSLSKPIQQQFYIDEGNLTLSGNPEIANGTKITGSKTQTESEKFNQLHAAVNEEIKKLGDSIKLEKDPTKQKLLKARRDMKSEENKQITYNFFKIYPDSYIAAMNLYMMSVFYSADSVKKAYEAFTPRVKEFSLGKKVAELIRDTEAVAPGKMAIDFTTVDVNGKSLKLSDFKGKYVILDFWASWCVPCRASHPHLIKMYQQYKEKGLTIIGIASDDGREKVWKEAIAKDGVGIWHHALAGEDPMLAMKGEKSPNSIMGKYGVTALPTKFLIDPQGKILIRSIGNGPEDIDRKLAELLK